ncbi:MAG: M28 family peptidase [Promethearchaeota archaeon]
MEKLDRIKGEEIYNIAKRICEFGYRLAGTPEAIEAEKFIASKLREVGIDDVKLEEFTFPRWWPKKYHLTVLAESTPLLDEDHVIECFPYVLSGSTDLEGITAELTHVGAGTTMDFKRKKVSNKIVLIEGKMILNFYPTCHEMLFNSIELAKERGALGAIIINGSPLDAITYASFDSIYGWKRRIPAVSISTPDGQFLKYLCSQQDSTTRVNLIQVVEKKKAKSNFIIGTLSGTTEDIILLGTHVDSTFTGAMDNAGANAGLIAIAKYFAQVPLEKREKTLMLVGWTGHELGLIGVDKFVKTYQELLPKICTFIMLDGFGSKGYYNQADGAVIKTEQDEKRGLFISDNRIIAPLVIDSVQKHELYPSAYVSAKTLPVSDLPPFIFNKIPCIMIIGKSIFYHTKYDTIEKITPNQLERTVKAHVDIIQNLMKIPAPEIKKADGTLSDFNSLITPKKEIPPPSGDFMIFPYPFEEEFKALFVPTVLNAPKSILLKLMWEFGDGETSDVILTRHAYQKAGTYLARLKILDNHGNQNVVEKTIKVLKKQ